MLQEIEIKNFKSIKDEKFVLLPLTILTGVNSSGKSSVIQSILLTSYCYNKNQDLEKAIKRVKNFESIKNGNEEVSISLKFCNNSFGLLCDGINNNSTWYTTSKNKLELVFDKNLFYITANRIGQEDISEYGDDESFDIDGKYAFGYFQKYKDKTIDENIRKKDDVDNTLAWQLEYWVNYILDLDIKLYTEDINNVNVKVGFKINKGIVSTFNVGSGVSYLVKILIITLSMSENNVFIIENPEIHLHPKAVSRLMEFFVFIASRKRQLIIETHSEYLINKLRYEIFKGNFDQEKSIIYYKDNAFDKFKSIKINKNGKFIDINKNIINFPNGFLDTNLPELLEMM
ncbi:AAA family ATPase [Campylobacter sp. 19-13652]|uniref:AAA family ATPase n=1 Tax=Campylobacter sp. 19-13652 TaxID=2840180 RepID=UPI001C764925|nr:AAA family ATPase [Campylobacter sp. 19-13652]BCX78771.1 hypothetical protein LBC_02330 [Campylobacter sp. 19-13652]